MMRKFVITLLLLLPVVSYCETNDSTKMKKFEIGITYSPGYCYRSLNPESSAKSIADIRDDILEVPKFGYTTGLNLAFNISKKFTIEAGLLFSDKGTKTKKYAIIQDVPPEQEIRTLPITNIFIYHYHYLDIPLKINYCLTSGKLKFYLTTGVSTNIFLGQKTTTILQYNNGSIKKNKSTVDPGFSRVNFAVIAGLGINYGLTNKVNFKMEPIYQRSITSIVNAPIKNYLYSVGLNIGFYYTL